MRESVRWKVKQPSRRTTWLRRRLLFVPAALVGGLLLVVAHGAEQVDSGWSVAPSPSISFTFKSGETKRQIILDHVLEQSQTPLLENRLSDAPTVSSRPQRTNVTGQGGLRFAVRPDGVDGWRPAGPIVLPLHSPAGLQLAAPEASGPAEEAAASESSGDSAAATVTSEAYGAEDESPADADASLQWSSPQASENGAPALYDDTTTDTADNGEAGTEVAEDDAPAGSPAIAATPNGAEPTTSDEEPITPIDETPAPATEPAEDAPFTTDDDAATDSEAKTVSEPAEIGPIKEDGATRATIKKPTPPPPLTKQLVNLRARVRTVLKGYYRKQLNSRDNDPWEVMHGMLAYGVHSRIRQGNSRGAPVTSVGWLCYNKPCKNLTLLYVNPKGELRAKYGVGLQGHLGQMLAMLAQCRVSDEYPIRVGKKEFTIKDLIEAEKKTCYPKSELTFKLLAFQYYLDLNETWVNDQGVEWDFPKLIREELAQPIRGAACGGTHRLSSLSLTVKARQRRGEPLDGEYLRAKEFVEKYHNYAFSLQNRDGSLSTSWFRGRGDDSDINRRIKTTGHILEWLCYSLSDEELRQPRTVAAVTYLANLMYSNYDNEWEVGPMSHATHALLLYDERVFQPFDGENYETTYKPRPRTASSAKRSSSTMRR